MANRWDAAEQAVAQQQETRSVSKKAADLEVGSLSARQSTTRRRTAHHGLNGTSPPRTAERHREAGGDASRSDVAVLRAKDVGSSGGMRTFSCARWSQA